MLDDRFTLISKAIKEKLLNEKNYPLSFLEKNKHLAQEEDGEKEFILKNKANSREINILFHQVDTRRCFFIVTVINIKTGASFDVEDYLKIHKEQQIISENNNQNFNKFIENFFQALKEAVFGKLNSIIFKDEWEQVPFDWHGYK